MTRTPCPADHDARPSRTAQAALDRLARMHPPVPADAVVSSGHAFLHTAPGGHPPDAAARAKEAARTLRSLADHALVPVEPHVWKTSDRDLLLRLDGYGHTVPMDADDARLAMIDALSAPRLEERERAAIVAALHAIASSSTPPERSGAIRIGCSAPMPWRPADVVEDDAALVPMSSWWTGRAGTASLLSDDRSRRTVLDPDTAVLLPRIVAFEQGPVTMDDRTGARMRPVSWTGSITRALDPMGIVRALADLAAMLADHTLHHPVAGPIQTG